MSDRDHFARDDVQEALGQYAELEQAHRMGGPTPPDVNDFLAERGLTPPSGQRLVREDIIACPFGWHPVPIGSPLSHPGQPPFCTCEPN